MGTIDTIKGRTKEAAGALTGDQKLKQAGRTDQLAGKVKDAAGKIVDHAKDLVKKG